jgi:hypothetical protein
MPSPLVKEVQKIKNAIYELEKTTPLISEESRFEVVLKESIDVLKRHQYSVKKIHKTKYGVSSNLDLVDLFYHRLREYYPNIIPYRENIVDLSIAKELVEHVKGMTGFEYKEALGFCVEIVELVFEHKDEFGIDPNLMCNFRVFGQGSMSWVTEKAIYIYNREKENIDMLIKQADAETEKYEETHDIEFGFDNLDDIIKKI